jgi:hypothetical protein
MASPFAIFRKNQKVMLAVVGVLVMLAFVFLPMCSQTMGDRRSGSTNPVVVKTSQFGNLQESDLHAMMVRHRQFLTIMANLAQLAGIHPMMAERIASNSFLPATEDNVVDNWLLTNQAQQQGMVVDNASVNAFLKLWTRDAVKPESLKDVIKQSGYTGVQQLFDVLRKELMARQMRILFSYSLEGATPSERWDYFNRIKKSASIEIAGVDAAGFVQRVEDPNDEELKSFFEDHKNQYTVPGSPKPGFREPHKVAMQWFKIDQEKAAAAVTDQEIEQRYQQNKKTYDEMEKKLEEQKAQAAKKDEKKEDVKDAGKKDVEKSDAKKDEKKDAEKKEDSTQPVKTSPAEEPKKPDQPDASKKSSAVTSSSPFRLAALLQDKKPDEEKKAEKAPQKPAAEKKEPAAQEKPAEEKKEPAAEEKPGAEKKTEIAEATRKRIRQEIAQEKTNKIIESLREKMDGYRTAWNKYKVALFQEESKKEGERKKIQPPAKLDMDRLAAENGLAVGQTDLLSRWQMQSQPIGASMVNGRVPLSYFAYQTLPQYRPELSIDMQGNLYLFWKTEETKDRVPAFDDPGVRDEVLRAWKMTKARDLAMNEAKAIAAEVQKSHKTLKESLADRTDMPVASPPPFSWFSFGSVALGSAPSAIDYSEVSGVDYPREEFMQTVFRLEPGEVGTAFNAPKTVAYVIQVKEFSPARDVLWKQFEVDDFSKYESAGQEDRHRVFQAWLDEIKKKAGLQWERKTETSSESSSSGEAGDGE